MVDIHSMEHFNHALSEAGNKLTFVKYYSTWRASCRALYPRANWVGCFHFYRSADGLLESFSCSLSKVQKIKDAIALHNTDGCSIGPPVSVGDIDPFGAPTQEKSADHAASR